MVFFPIMFVFILCVFCSIVMFRLLFLMFMHIRLIYALIKITYLLTYLLHTNAVVKYAILNEQCRTWSLINLENAFISVCSPAIQLHLILQSELCRHRKNSVGTIVNRM